MLRAGYNRIPATAMIPGVAGIPFLDHFFHFFVPLNPLIYILIQNNSYVLLAIFDLISVSQNKPAFKEKPQSAVISIVVFSHFFAHSCGFQTRF